MDTPRAAERGATSTEAALLLGAVFLVALPAFALLGRQVSGSFDAACDDISRSQGSACVVVQGGGPPAIRPVPPRSVAETSVADWAARTRPDEALQEVVCDPVPDVPPPGTSSDCDLTFAGGATMRVVVSWVDPVGDPVVEPESA